MQQYSFNWDKFNQIAAELTGWEYFECSVVYSDQYDPYEEPIWVLRPTELYREIQCHRGYKLMLKQLYKSNKAVKRSDLFTGFVPKLGLKFNTCWLWLSTLIYELKIRGFEIQLNNDNTVLITRGQFKFIHTGAATDSEFTLCLYA